MSKNNGAPVRPDKRAGSIEFTLTMPAKWLDGPLEALRALISVLAVDADNPPLAAGESLPPGR